MKALAFLAIILIAAPAFAQSVFHPASEVAAGIFGSSVGGGNFTFNNSMFVLDNLGIGTIAPAEKLVVNGTLRVDNATGSAVLFVNATSGNVGIGTASPARKLSVLASSGSITPFMLMTNDYNGVNTGSTFVVEFGAASGNNYTMLGALSAGGSSWNNLILQPSGNVGIGTTTPSQKLTVAGDANITGNLIVGGNISGGSPVNIVGGINVLSGNMNVSGMMYASDFVSPTPLRGNILSNGGFEVWQRGTSFSIINGFLADMWKTGSGGGGLTTTQEATTKVSGNYGMKCVRSANSYGQEIYQKVENYLEFRGKTVTFSIQVNPNLGSKVRAYIDDGVSATYSDYAPASVWTKSTVVKTLSASATKLQVGVALVSWPDVVTYYLDEAMLVVGNYSSGVDFLPLNAGEDLMRCRRYYQKGYFESVQQTGVGWWHDTISLIPPMRTTPGIAISNITGGTLSGQNCLSATEFCPTGTRTVTIMSYNWDANCDFP